MADSKLRFWVGNISLILGVLLTVGNLADLWFKFSRRSLEEKEKQAYFPLAYYEVALDSAKDLLFSPDDFFSGERGRVQVLRTEVLERVLVPKEERWEWLTQQSRAFSEREFGEAREIFANPALVLLNVPNAGARQAVSVTLLATRATMPEGGLIFIPTELSFRPSPPPLQKSVKLHLGEIASGEHVQVPIAIAVRVSGGSGDPASMVTVGTVFVPHELHYRERTTGEMREVKVRGMIEYPILVKGEEVRKRGHPKK